MILIKGYIFWEHCLITGTFIGVPFTVRGGGGGGGRRAGHMCGPLSPPPPTPHGRRKCCTVLWHAYLRILRMYLYTQKCAMGKY